MDPINARIASVSVDSEAMVYAILTQVSWDTSEAEEGEGLVHVVRLDDLANVPNGSLVLVVRAHIVERLR